MKRLMHRTLFMAGALAISVSQVAAADNKSVSWAEIDAKAKPLSGRPVNLSSNYWLAWTGAWDTVILKQQKLWQKWLPVGSQVEWKRNLQGPPVITDLVANKQQIGYIGDNPSIVATTKRDLAPISIVAVNTTSPGRMCGLVVVRADAPPFKDYHEAVKWLDGKRVGVSKGSCADRLGQQMFARENVTVNWHQMQGEVIVSSLQANKLDAAVLYEPHVSKAVFDGYARYAVAPAGYGEQDANTVLMRRDFIDANREAAVAWLKANIEALYFMRDRPVDTINLVKQELPEYSRENLWYALYGKLPDGVGAAPQALKADMIVSPASRALLERGHAFLRDLKVHQEQALGERAIDDSLVAQAFRELGLDPAQGLFELQASADNPFKGDDLRVAPAAR